MKKKIKKSTPVRSVKRTHFNNPLRVSVLSIIIFLLFSALPPPVFATTPSIPSLFPLVGVTSTGFRAQFYTSTNATSYKVDIATDSGFTSYVSGYQNRDIGNPDLGGYVDYAVTGMSPNTLYYFRVRAYNSADGTTSGNSTVQSTTTLPAAPTASAATNVTTTSFSANWSSSAGATYYLLNVSPTSNFTTQITGCAGTLCQQKNVGNVTTYSVTGLTANTTYYFKVNANYGTDSNVITVQTASPPPSAPAVSAAYPKDSTSFSANWSTSAGATGYYFDASTASDFSSFLSGFNNLDVGNVTTKSVTGLSANTTYYYRVRAYGAGGTSVNSNTITLATGPLPPVVGAPSNITAGGVTINWSASSGADNYHLQVATDVGFTSGAGMGCQSEGSCGNDYSVVGNVTTNSVWGLTANTKYYYHLKSHNASGSYSNYTDTYSFITMPGAAVHSTTGADDATERNDNTLFDGTGYYLYMAANTTSTGYISGFRLNNITIPQGATISSATFRCRIQSTSYDDPLVHVYAEAVDNAVSFTTNADVASRAKTTANVAWSGTGIGAIFLNVKSPDITSVVQEVINRAGWVSGNSLDILIKGDTNASLREFRCYTMDAGGNYGGYIDITQNIQSSIPTATAVTNFAGTSFSANWNAATYVYAYYLDVANDSGFTDFTGPLTTACGGGSCNNKDVGNVTTYAVTGLTNGNTYYYRLRSYNAVGTSGNSNTITVGPPPAPSVNASTNIAATSFSANWSASAGSTTYNLDVSTASDFSSFVNGCGGSACNNFDTTNVTTYSVTGLSCGTTYYNRVRVTNTMGTSPSSSSTITTLIPCVPTASNPTSVVGTGFSANWSAATGATGYYLDVATDSGFTSFVATGCGGGSCSNKNVGNVTTYAVANLSSGTTYYYRVRGYNASGTSASSNTITVPGAPTANAATAKTATSFSANWSAATGATKYYLDVATDSGFTSFVATGCGGGSCNNKDVGNVVTYSVTSLSCSTTYYYRVRSANASATSGNSGTITAILIPCAPVTNSATNVNDSSFSSNWSASSGATSYKLSVSTVADCTSSYVTACGGASCNLYNVGNVTTYSTTPLSANTTYYFCLKATNASGDSALSNITSQLTAPSPPTPSVTNVYSTNFIAHASSVTGATSYNLYVATDAGFSSPVSGYNPLSTTLTSRLVNGLTAATTYYFRYKSVNAGGTSSFSSTLSTTTKPNTPTANAATNVHAVDFQANWNTQTGVTGYKVDVAKNSSFTDFALGQYNVNVPGASTGGYIINTGIYPNTTYYYRVRSVNASGIPSEPSNTITVTTTTGSTTYCPEVNSEDYSLTYSCQFPNTIDGVSNGNLTIGNGATLTVAPGQIVAWTPGKSILLNGPIVFGNGASLKRGHVTFTDTDNDGYPDSITPTFSTNTPSGTTRARYQLTSYTLPDCDSNPTTGSTVTTNCTTKIVFITNSQYSGNLGGLSGADAKCQSEAQNAGLPGTFKAWLSDDTGAASTRLSHYSYKYILTTGTAIAYNWTDLTDGTLLNPININQFGDTKDANAWTASNSNGTHNNTGFNCSNWSVSDTSTAYNGSGGSTVSTWSQNSRVACTTNTSLYCFEQ